MGNEGVSVCLVACGTTSAPYENEDDDTLSPIFAHRIFSSKESRPVLKRNNFDVSLEISVFHFMFFGQFFSDNEACMD